MSVSYAVFGHTTLDNVISTDGSAYFRVAGGAGMYAASGAAFWCKDREVGLITKIGARFDPEDERFIRAHRAIDDAALTRMEREGIKLWMLFDDDGYRHWVLQHDSCSREAAAPSVSDIPSGFLDEVRGCHFSPLPPQSVEELIKVVPKGCYVQLDPHYEWFFPKYERQWKRILSRLDTILPSEDELCKFFDIPYGQPISTLKEYALRLADMGPNEVVVKLGERGAFVLERDRGTCTLVPSCARRVVDATGAGDTFGGCYLVGRAGGETPASAMIRGAAGASLTLERKGVMENFRLTAEAAAQRYDECLTEIGSLLISL
ncbi:MAG: carbohydrate kinase family protein [Clostridia bacterium]|nr:carbohydrate kinase family protein [Clostridia bacterium]